MSLLLLARAPVEGEFWLNVFPSMLLLGIGCGMAMNPIFMAAMDGISESESGLASGIVNTAFMMGGALGLFYQCYRIYARGGFGPSFKVLHHKHGSIKQPDKKASNDCSLFTSIRTPNPYQISMDLYESAALKHRMWIR